MRIAGVTRVTVTGVTALILLVAAAAGIVVDAAFGAHSLPRAVVIVLAVAALAAVPLAAVAASQWSATLSGLRGELSELERLRSSDEDVRRRSEERKRQIRTVLDAGDRLDVAYQPLVDLGSGRLVGYEALTRFDGGGPEGVFELAHSIGLGLELELMAAGRALDRVGEVPHLSINVSPGTLVSDAFHDLLAGCGAPDRVVVELTEHVVVEDYGLIAVAVGRLRALGARLAVDDAGSGYASLRHVIDLRPDIIKLDRSLVCTIDSDSARRALAASLVGLAEGMGADLVAEGIETVEELEACVSVGIRLGQGYLLGRPEPLAAVA